MEHTTLGTEPAPESASDLTGKAALITGASRRIGAAIARRLHGAGMNLTLHYRSADAETRELQTELQRRRPDSVTLIQADLLDTAGLPAVVAAAARHWGRLDLLVNNASSFFPTPVDTASERDWDVLLGSNLKAPFFLIQAALPALRASGGSVVNLIDIHAERPRDGHPIYSTAKAGLAMMTKSLAWELSPLVRVNGVAPGAILWAANATDHSQHDEILNRVPLSRLGDPDDIARAVLFLTRDGGYITGQILAVDGGRSLNM